MGTENMAWPVITMVLDCDECGNHILISSIDPFAVIENQECNICHRKLWDIYRENLKVARRKMWGEAMAKQAEDLASFNEEPADQTLDKIMNAVQVAVIPPKVAAAQEVVTKRMSSRFKTIFKAMEDGERWRHIIYKLQIAVYGSGVFDIPENSATLTGKECEMILTKLGIEERLT